MENEKKYLFDNPQNVKHVLHFLYGCCVLFFALDFVIHRHTTHSWENLWGFYAIFDFVGCVVLVLVVKWMCTLDTIAMNMKVILEKSAGVMP